MTEENSASAKVYPTAERGKLSILDMLEYFVKHGAMRVSDLHIKIGTPPAYRIDQKHVFSPNRKSVPRELIHSPFSYCADVRRPAVYISGLMVARQHSPCGRLIIKGCNCTLSEKPYGRV